MKAIEWGKIWPVLEIGETGEATTSTGDVVIGFELLLPELFTLDSDAYENIHESLVQMVGKLPIGCVMHKVDYYFVESFEPFYSGTDSLGVRSNKSLYAELPKLGHYSQVFFSLHSGTRAKGPFQNTVVRRSSILGKNPIGDIGALSAAVANLDSDLRTSLNSIKGIKAKRMDGIAVWNAVTKYVEWSWNSPATQTEKPELPNLALREGGLLLGSNNVAVVTIGREGHELVSHKKSKSIPAGMFGNGVLVSDSLPSNMDLSMTYPITFGLPFDHVVHTIIEVCDNDAALSALRNQANQLNIFSSMGYAPADRKKRDIMGFVESVVENKAQVCKTAMAVVLGDPSRESLQKKLSLLDNAMSNMNGTRGMVENEEALPLFIATLPTNGAEFYRQVTHVVQQAVCLLPVETHYRSDAKGILLQDRMGNPVVVDTWDSRNRYMVNRNGFIIGPSGSGKSFTINFLNDQILNDGDHLVIIDIGKSYEKLVREYKGLYFDSSNENHFRFNLFLTDRDENGRFVIGREDSDFMDETEASNRGGEDKVNFILTVICNLWKKGETVPGEVRAILKDIIKKYYAHVNEKGIFPDFNGFYEFLSVYEASMPENRRKFFDFDSMKLILEPFYAGGEYEKLLNSNSNVDLTNHRFIVFELEAISKNQDIFPLVCIIITELVAEKVRRLPKGVRKRFLIDEALDFLKSDISEYIAYLYRTFRKKGGQVLLATQTVRFFDSLNRELVDSIMANSDLKIFLDHSNNSKDFDAIKRIASLTDSSIRLLSTLEKRMEAPYYREALIIMGSYARVFRIMVGPEAAAMYTTNPDELSVLEALFEKLGNQSLAVRQFVEDRMISKT